MLRLACALAVLLFSVSALADERARLMREADAAYAAGQWVQARSLWRAVWEVEHSAVAACNIGQISWGAGDALQAVEWLTVCLRLQATPRTPRARQLDDARRADLALAKQQLGTIEVFTNREGAKVSVAGRPAETGTPVFVTPGKVVVTAQHKDRVARVEVDVPASEERLAIVEFREAPAPRAPVVVAPVAPLRPTPGPMPSIVPSAPTTPTYTVVIAGGVSLTVGALASGIAGHIGARNIESTLALALISEPKFANCDSQTTPDCAAWSNAKANLREFRAIETAGFTVAGVIAVGTVLYAVIARPKLSPPGLGVVQW